MEQNLHSPEVYDFRQYDRIWQRVAPGLEPYPTPRQETAVPASTTQMAAQETQTTQMLPSAQARQESQLPGAEVNPCCMGSAAAEMLEVLTGFIEEELADQRYFQALLRRAPAWARQQLRAMAEQEGEHARRLMAAHYLITGTCYRPSVNCGQICLGRWCDALREAYHAAACNGLNYQRAAEGTTDVCLTKLLEELSGNEYRHASTLMAMLERSLTGMK